jgi:hypothetical protein
MGKRDQSQLEQDIRKFMSNPKHSPFYDSSEVKEGVNYEEPFFRLISQFGGVLASMQCRHIITTGSASAPDKYVLKERMDQYLKEHEGQVL